MKMAQTSFTILGNFLEFFSIILSNFHSRIYPLISSPRGEALIINNQEFSFPHMYPHRQGAGVDADNLETLFTQLDFHVSVIMVVFVCDDIISRSLNTPT